MDFDDTPEEAAFRAEARAWLEANAIPKGSPEDFSAGYFAGDIDPADYIKRCRWWQGQLHEGGWAGITWPKAFGGQGGKPIQEAIFAEEQAKWGVSVGTFAVALGMVGPDADAARHARAAGRGGSGRCCAARRCGASSSASPRPAPTWRRCARGPTRDGDEWVIDGQKVWTSNAQYSRVGRPHRPLVDDGEAARHEASPTSPSTCGRPASRSGRCARSTATPTSTRSSSTACGSRPTRSSARSTSGWKVAVTTLSNERVAIAGGSGMSDPQRLRAARRASWARVPTRSSASASPGVHTANEILRYLKLRTRTAMSQGRAARTRGVDHEAELRPLREGARRPRRRHRRARTASCCTPTRRSTACSSRSSSTRCRRRSAAAPTRSSATSSASGCSASRGSPRRWGRAPAVERP